MNAPRLHKLGDLKAIEERVVLGEQAVARLRSLLEDPDAEVRGPATALSGRFPAADDLIERVLEVSREDASPEVRLEALEALAAVVAAGELAGAERADYAPDPTLDEPSAPVYAAAKRRLLAGLDAEAERGHALLGLAPLADRLEPAQAAIDRALGGTSAERRQALRAIGRSGSRRWREAVADALDDGSAQVACEAALAAARVGLRDLRPRLEALLARGPAQARVGAARALGRLAGRDAAATLLGAAEREQDEAVRLAARHALADLGLDG